MSWVFFIWGSTDFVMCKNIYKAPIPDMNPKHIIQNDTADSSYKIKRTVQLC